MNGAGHGSTLVGPGGNYWHFASMSLSATVNWERRLCMYPTSSIRRALCIVIITSVIIRITLRRAGKERRVYGVDVAFL